MQNTAYSGSVRFKTAETLSAGQLNEESIKAAGATLSIRPNPATDILHLDNLKGKATISIITQDGRMVDKKVGFKRHLCMECKEPGCGNLLYKG